MLSSDPPPAVRVLAIAEDLGGLVTACRVHAPLITLKRQGVVADYWVTDSRLTGLPPDYAFDVLWVQRAPAPRLIERIVERFPGAYLHDMDDLLLAEPAYVREGEFPDRDSLLALIASSKVFTAPSERLVRLIEKRGASALWKRSVICPNAVELPAQPPRAPCPPRGLIFTQSHRVALTESREAVLGAVRDFTATSGLPLYYFGPPLEVLGEGVERLIGPVVACGYLDFWRYHVVLSAWPSMLGIAPLETAGDERTLDFIAGKSDVKMVEFAGFGHPAVYSRALPYVDTDLRAGALADNDRQSWHRALEGVLTDGWSRLAEEQAAVSEARSLEGVARQCWALALSRARLPEACAAGELRGSLVRRRRLARRWLGSRTGSP
jgi:hypothetical protein